VNDSATPAEAWSHWGGDGPDLVFAHANGFPPATYRLFLEGLSRRFTVTAFAARPLWPDRDPTEIDSWRDLANDLRGGLQKRGREGIVGVGHSLGGVLSIMAAAADPERFRALALVDPVVFSGVHWLFWRALKNFGFSHRFHLVRGARRRRNRFPSLEAVRSAYAEKSVFSTWKPEALEHYIRAGFEETGRGDVTLRYSREWEARIFELTPASVWSDLRGVDVPILFIRGASSETFLPSTAARAERDLDRASVIEIEETSHFLPMEQPAKIATAITDWYEGLEFSD
jgi:pimeloyl-ACP methyl ester carboxylesterase